ncbi:hypothetical protein ASF16_22060 [Acidovorax sp. Leaf78]|nr:hypothetical protein ASF16_22060 [Acidovorax sp. Leaf78]
MLIGLQIYLAPGFSVIMGHISRVTHYVNILLAVAINAVKDAFIRNRIQHYLSTHFSIVAVGILRCFVYAFINSAPVSATVALINLPIVTTCKQMWSNLPDMGHPAACS